MSRLNTLDGQVRYILRADKESRNSDITLTIALWRKFYPEAIKLENGQLYIAVHDLFNLPREDNIKRVRAKIQNVEKLYIPTDPDIAEKRGWELESWREYLGYDGQTSFL